MPIDKYVRSATGFLHKVEAGNGFTVCHKKIMPKWVYASDGKKCSWCFPKRLPEPRKPIVGVGGRIMTPVEVEAAYNAEMNAFWFGYRRRKESK